MLVRVGGTHGDIQVGGYNPGRHRVVDKGPVENEVRTVVRSQQVGVTTRVCTTEAGKPGAVA